MVGVSPTFGQKINTDVVIEGHASKTALAEEFEQVRDSPDFVAAIGHGDEATYSEEELRRKLELAHIFTKMHNLVLLARGQDVIADDFRYFSPATGVLDKDSFMALTKTVDVAFSSIVCAPEKFKAFSDGVVSYLSSFSATFDGPLRVGDASVPPNFARVVSDMEVNTLSFDGSGRLKSFATGVVVRKCVSAQDLDVEEQIDSLQKKIESQEVKVQGLAGQASALAYQKGLADIESYKLEQENLRNSLAVDSNTGGFGGVKGLLAAVGVDMPADVTQLLGNVPYKSVEGTQQFSFSAPSEIRGYAAMKDFQHVLDLKGGPDE